jgi:flagellar hook assembly protein FlgD
MKPKTNYINCFLILAGWLFLFPGLSQALAAPTQISPIQTIPTTIDSSLIKSTLMTPPYISCLGKIDSQLVDAHGDTLFKVIWTITSASADGNLYKLYYSDNAGFHNRIESTTSNPLPKPYLLTLLYPLSPTTTSKTITETVSLLNYATEGTQKTSTCQILLKRTTVLDNPLQKVENPGNVTNVVFDNLSVTPTSFEPTGSNNMKISYKLDSDGTDVYLTIKILDSSKSSTLYSKTSKINYNGFNFLLWNGKDSSSAIVPAGTYWVRASVSDKDPADSTATTLKTLTDQTFKVTAPAADENDNNSGDQTSESESGGSSESESSSDASSGNSGSAEGNTGAGSEEAAKPVLLPSPLELKCTPQAKILYFENDEPAYDRIFENCTISLPATVKAGIYNNSYDPAADDNSANLIKEILSGTSKKKGSFTIGWDGFDEYDRPVKLDNYNFVVEASIDNLHKTKISAKSFKVDNVPAPAPANDQTGAAAPGTPNASATGENTGSTSNPSSPITDALHGAATAATGLAQQASSAIFGEETGLTEQQATTDNQPATRTMSKCPNVFYPIDITNSPYETLIKKAFDECLVSGYPDGTFHHKDFITRPEAIKIVILASGNIGKQGCFDADCGSPFYDVPMWAGPWVRAAWDLKLISGVAPDRLGTGNITRAETVALLVKAFKITPYRGCYTPNCGAGYPNDLFSDIKQSWQGPYLRAAWDKGIIQSMTPGQFYPDNPISRGMFLELLYQAKSIK